MSLATATITFDISDMVGVDFDARRTKVWVTTNVPGDSVIDTVGNQIRLGDGLGSVGEDGTGSVSVWIPGTGSNPTTWQTYVHVDYGDRRPAAQGGKREVRIFGPFTITASADLADLVAEQEVPPTYLSQVTAELQTYVDEAAVSAAEAEQSRLEAEALILSDLGTTDGQTRALIENPLSETSTALGETYTQLWRPNTAYENGVVLIGYDGRVVISGYDGSSSGTDFDDDLNNGDISLRGVSTVAGLNGAVQAADLLAALNIPPGEKVGDSVLDFRQMADGPAASAIVATRGTYLAQNLNSNHPEHYVIEGGRFKTSVTTAEACYVQVKVGDTTADKVQHSWLIVEFDAAPTADTTVLMLWPGPSYWGTFGGVAGTNTAGVHDGLSARFASTNVARVDADRYPNTLPIDSRTVTAALPTPSVTGGTAQSFAGKRVRWDITIDKLTGRRRHYINGYKVIDYTDVDVLSYISQYALFELTGTGAQFVDVVEFGASPDLPVELAGDSFARGGGTLISDLTLTSTPQLWRTIDVTYPASGTIVVMGNPFIDATSGQAMLGLGPDTGGPDGGFYDQRQRVGDSGTHGRVFFKQRRYGVPGTNEKVGIWGRSDGAGTVIIRGGTYGGEGPDFFPAGVPTL